jgi:hypothetical protein
MPLRSNQGADNLILNSGVDAMYDSGILEIRTGPQPASAADAPTGVLLWTEPLPADALTTATTGIKQKNGTWLANAVATGQARHFRLKRTGDTGVVSETQPRIDGEISLPDQGGDLTVNDLSFVTGQQVEILTVEIETGI